MKQLVKTRLVHLKPANKPMEYKKHITIEEELAYLDDQVAQMRAYLDGIKLEDIEDRIHWRQTKTGQMPLLTASIESQVKSKMETIERLAKIVSHLDDVRNKYKEKKMKTRGDVDYKDTILDDDGV